jgi:hypothetical protein
MVVCLFCLKQSHSCGATADIESLFSQFGFSSSEEGCGVAKIIVHSRIEVAGLVFQAKVIG